MLSYIDILASDSTPNARIIHDVRQCIGLLAERNLPMRVQSGDTHFTFDLEPTLAPAWRRELEILLQYAISVRVPF